MYFQCLLFSLPPPLLPPPQITIKFYRITARAIFYSADVRLWHLILPRLSGRLGRARGPCRAQGLSARPLGGFMCSEGPAVGVFSHYTEQEGKEQREKGSKEKLAPRWVRWRAVYPADWARLVPPLQWQGASAGIKQRSPIKPIQLH